VTASAVVRPGRPHETGAVLELWRRAEATPTPTDTADALARLFGEPQAALIVAENDERIVEHDHPWAVGFWDSPAADGYARDPRMLRYVKTLPA
jgi:hypothetical protein